MARHETLLSDVIEAIRTAATPIEIWDAVLDFFHGHEIPMVSYHHHAPPDAQGGNRTRVFADGFPEDWVCHYIDEKLFLIDPIPEFALQTAQPFFWHDIEKLKRLISTQSDYMEELRAAGVGEGLALQVFGPTLRHGYVGLGFGGERREVNPVQLTNFQWVAQLAHLRYCELVPIDPVAGVALSHRERQILEWIARGKSNPVIGEILGLSSHTVDAYIRRIFAKLEVSDRTTAAIRGIGSGLIKGVA